MKRTVKILTAAVMSAALISAVSAVSYAESVKSTDGVLYRYSDSGEKLSAYTGKLTGDDGKLRYYNKGIMLTSTWIKVGGKRTYYARKNGELAVGNVKIGGKKYRFRQDGKLIDKTEDIWGIKMELSDISTTGFNISLSQDAVYLPECELSFDYTYRLYKTVSSEYDEEAGITKVKRVMVGKKAFYEREFLDGTTDIYGTTESGWFNYYCGELEPGEYRAVVYITKYGGNKTQTRRIWSDLLISAYTPNIWGVSMYAKNFNDKGLTLVIGQSGGNHTGELLTGEEFYIEKENEGKWEKLEPLGDLCFDDIGIPIEDGQTRELTVNWENIYGPLPSGRYRLVKPVMDLRAPGEYDKKDCRAYFSVNDNNTNVDDWDIEITVDSATPTGAELTVRRTGTYRGMIDKNANEYYLLKKSKNGEWEVYKGKKYTDLGGCESIGIEYSEDSGAGSKETVGFESFYGKLTKGEYRIAQIYRNGYTEKTVYGDFVIN